MVSRSRHAYYFLLLAGKLQLPEGLNNTTEEYQVQDQNVFALRDAT
jgi:hypothetical protein